MAKYNKEELKQIRLNNLAKGRMGQGRPKGSKNKVTAKRVNDMIIKFLDQEENKRKPNVNPNITTDHAIEIMRTTLTAYYQKNHPNFPMYGYLIDFFCLSCKSLLEKYNLEGSTNVSPEISAIVSGGILAFPIAKDIKQGKFKKQTTQNTDKKVDNIF